MQFTARAGEALAESLNLSTTMQRVLELIVPAMADWAVIDLFDEQGRVRIDAMVHADPAMAPLAARLIGASTARPEFAEMIATALRAPHTQVNARLEPAVLAAMVLPEYREAILALDGRSSIIVPLRSGGRSLGALVAYWSSSPRTFGEEDVPLFEEIARRAAVAIENAQLYESERHVANAFQRAALPISLPDVTGIRFDAVYVAARNEAQIGGELQRSAAQALIATLLLIFGYIAVRFHTWRLSLGAILAVLHDPILVLGTFSLTRTTFDLTVVAAMLAVIGYSLNDTVVVFDRIRERFHTGRRLDPVAVLDQSINQTLSRTIMTKVVTLIVVVALYALGGAVLRGFSEALIIGILAGTYSSIYISSAVALDCGLKAEHLLASAVKKPLDDMP